MAWTTLTEAMVLGQFTEVEAAGIEAAQGGSTSKLPEILQKTIDQAREDILAGGHELDADATKLPAGLHNDVIAVARWKLLISLPGLEDLQTKVREKEHNDATQKLRDIARGKRRVEPPGGSMGFSASPQWNSENKVLGRMNPTPRPGVQGAGAGRYANDDAPQDVT